MDRFTLVGGLEHEFYFPFSWECHHPNWRTHIFHRGWNHQPVPLYLNNISPLLAGWEQPLCPQIDPRNDRSQSSSGPTARGSDPVTMCWLVTPLGAILPWLLFILGSIFPWETYQPTSRMRWVPPTGYFSLIHPFVLRVSLVPRRVRQEQSQVRGLSSFQKKSSVFLLRCRSENTGMHRSNYGSELTKWLL